MLFDVCTDVRVLRIESSVRYFLGIVGILGFCNFVFFFSSRRNTLIFQSCTLVDRIEKDSISSMDINIIGQTTYYKCLFSNAFKHLKIMHKRILKYTFKYK